MDTPPQENLSSTNRDQAGSPQKTKTCRIRPPSRWPLLPIASIALYFASHLVSCRGDSETNQRTESMGGANAMSDGEGGDDGGTMDNSPEIDSSSPDGLEQITSGRSEVNCEIVTERAEIAPKMQTVGIIEFNTNMAGIEQAAIQFGETRYRLLAPVDLEAPNHRTLLLGMTENTKYYYRIAVASGDEFCLSDSQTLQTGPLGNGGPISVDPEMGPSSASVAPGFIVTSSGLTDNWAWIMDHRGRLVWSYEISTEGGSGGFDGITRARLSYDGKSMFARDLNVSGSSDAGYLYKIALDGSSEQQIPLSTSHHDFTVIPGGVAYIAKKGSESGCDAIRTIDENGQNDTLLYDMWNVLEPFENSGRELCHVNSIQYNSYDQSFTVSDRERDVIVKISAEGDLQWALGGSASDFRGDDWKWEIQHGHHLYDPNHLVLFNNGPLGSDTNSSAIQLRIDTTNMTVAKEWSYSGAGRSGTLGDAQHLPNGNTLVTSSNTGALHEVDPSGTLVRAFELPSCGYANHRTTLYGPPPR